MTDLPRRLSRIALGLAAGTALITGAAASLTAIERCTPSLSRRSRAATTRIGARSGAR